ncbi:MAG: DUF3592 domain-containing protein [Anaerolineales bacterium]
MLITCPWCGTNHLEFQSNCKNCGGPLPAPAQMAASAIHKLIMPPAPPREISAHFAWRWLLTDSWTIASFVFVILGGTFSLTGVGLTAGIITAFIGIPFLLLGLAFLGGGMGLLYWRYTLAQNALKVLRDGQATRGEITALEQNYSVRINGRNPWTISYKFSLDGKDYEGKVTTLNDPGIHLAPGNPAAILYLPDAPQFNGLYPHP